MCVRCWITAGDLDLALGASELVGVLIWGVLEAIMVELIGTECSSCIEG